MGGKGSHKNKRDEHPISNHVVWQRQAAPRSADLPPTKPPFSQRFPCLIFCLITTDSSKSNERKRQQKTHQSFIIYLILARMLRFPVQRVNWRSLNFLCCFCPHCRFYFSMQPQKSQGLAALSDLTNQIIFNPGSTILHIAACVWETICSTGQTGRSLFVGQTWPVLRFDMQSAGRMQPQH